MGYACPVCSDPQADRGHLANHLAFTAMLGDDDHEAWLDEHAPEWGEMSEAELAGIVADNVEETEFPQLFEDTADGLGEGSNDPPAERSGALFDEGDGHGHDHGAHDHAHGDGDTHDHGGHPRGAVDTAGPMDDETAEALAEAREMTARMLGLSGDGDDDE